MHILVIDGNHVKAEFREKFGPGHEYTYFSTHYADLAEQNLRVGEIQVAAQVADVVFCFKSAQTFRLFSASNLPVFAEASCDSLLENLWRETDVAPDAMLFGFCGLPTLLNRSLLEVSLYNEANRQKLAETCAALGTNYRIVEDRVGLVTPRVICQIINEACFALQEATASMQDIDLGMKLGTNYPHGPFAWANAIGVERVYAVLEAMWNDTHDERYKVCPLLKRQALRGEPFAV
ncbi:3-hydroxyacyl-CoA dehydrogenase family protein [Hymenobacter sp. B1770]|uniref:3-hydroxyacyl-CoA dehydrogenase family protein n=1 Tax=Hymenobacter sp. B1770 TaxID=1718788 RepID=UPI003CEEB82A